jgi:hypothetical protein
LSFVVAKEREGGAETGAKGGIDLGRIGTDDGKLAVIDL